MSIKMMDYLTQSSTPFMSNNSQDSFIEHIDWYENVYLEYSASVGSFWDVMEPNYLLAANGNFMIQGIKFKLLQSNLFID